MKILEFYGGERWRIDEGAEMSRCIQRLAEIKEIQHQMKKQETPCRDKLERRPGGREKKLHHANNLRRMEKSKT